MTEEKANYLVIPLDIRAYSKDIMKKQRE